MVVKVIEYIIRGVQDFINLSLNNEIGQAFLSLLILSGGVFVAKSIYYLLKSSTTD